jgi:hypothetical protein
MLREEDRFSLDLSIRKQFVNDLNDAFIPAWPDIQGERCATQVSIVPRVLMRIDLVFNCEHDGGNFAVSYSAIRARPRAQLGAPLGS